jgi:hypothetical protein
MCDAGLVAMEEEEEEEEEEEGDDRVEKVINKRWRWYEMGVSSTS